MQQKRSKNLIKTLTKPMVSTPVSLGNVRGFTDEAMIQEQESSSADYSQAAAASPPPDESGDRPY